MRRSSTLAYVPAQLTQRRRVIGPGPLPSSAATRPSGWRPGATACRPFRGRPARRPGSVRTRYRRGARDYARQASWRSACSCRYPKSRRIRHLRGINSDEGFAMGPTARAPCVRLCPAHPGRASDGCLQRQKRAAPGVGAAFVFRAMVSTQARPAAAAPGATRSRRIRGSVEGESARPLAHPVPVLLRCRRAPAGLRIVPNMSTAPLLPAISGGLIPVRFVACVALRSRW
jgi:hypothetical protein